MSKFMCFAKGGFTMNAFNKAIHQRGLYATTRQSKNLGIDFIDCYVAVFGKMPRIV